MFKSNNLFLVSKESYSRLFVTATYRFTIQMMALKTNKIIIKIIIFCGFDQCDQQQHPIANRFPIKGCVNLVKDFREAWSCVSPLISPQTRLLDPWSLLLRVK